MPPHRPAIPAAPKPTKIFFDPYNSTSTGHQVADPAFAGTAAWRESRTRKLVQQLGDTSGRGGEKHLSDLVGAGSENWRKDGRKENGDWEVGAPGLREPGWQDISILIDKQRRSTSISSGTSKDKSVEKRNDIPSAKIELDEIDDGRLLGKNASSAKTSADMTSEMAKALTQNTNNTQQTPQIFRGLTIYLNGSTAPLVSDHKLKQLFAQYGGNSSLVLGRRSVTHVILGDSCGGGLASGKIQKEIRTVRGKGIKFVNARWILDSIEKGIRQPEGKYLPPGVGGRLAGGGQASVKGLFASRDGR